MVFICCDCIKRKQSHVDEELYSPWVRSLVWSQGLKEPLSRTCPTQQPNVFFSGFLVSQLYYPHFSRTLLKLKGYIFVQNHIQGCYSVYYSMNINNISVISQEVRVDLILSINTCSLSHSQKCLPDMWYTSKNSVSEKTQKHDWCCVNWKVRIPETW